jgi:hypothetical protein
MKQSLFRPLAALLFVVTSILMFSSCDADQCRRCKGSDGVSPIPLSKVERIIVDFDGTLRLFQDTFQFSAVAGKDAAIKNINTEVVNGSWTIRYDRCVTCEEDVIVTLVVPNLKSIDLNSKARVEAVEPCNFPDLEITQRGSGLITFESLQSANLKINHNGSGDILLKGSGNGLAATMSGSGVIRTFEMPFNTVVATNNSSGSILVTALQNLTANINGSGNIQYRGAPSITQNISGSGQLIDAN